MASIIKLKRSLTTGAIPSTLVEGEIAVNVEDKKLFVGGKNGGANVQTLSGDLYNLSSASNNSHATTAADIILSVDNQALSNDVITLIGTQGVDVERHSNGSITIAAAPASTVGNLRGDTGTALPEEFNIAILGGEGIDTAASGNTITISAEIATSTNIGSAKFNTGNFAVNAGDVTIKTGGVTTTEIAAKTILAGDIADGQITPALIANQSLTANVYQDSSIALGSKTTGNYVESISAGNTSVVITGSGSETAAVTVALGDNIGANTSGNAATASKLATARNIALSGDLAGSANFDGSGNISISATIQADSVALGTDTSGDYVATVTGTTNEIEITGAGTEGRAAQIGLPETVNLTNGNITNLTVTTDTTLNGDNVTIAGNTAIGGDLNVDGNLNVEGAVTYISSSTVNIDDAMLKLSANNAADITDSGVYAMYIEGATTKYAGYFRDATDNVFRFYTGIQTEPGATVDTTATGYALAQIEAIIDGGTY